jgi:hypothetical protein
VRRGATIPGGVLSAWAVLFVPIAGGAIERLAGLSPAGRGSGSGISVGGVSAPSSAPFTAFSGRFLVLSLLVVVAGLAVYTLTRFAFVLAFVAAGALISAELLVPAVDSGPSPADEATALIVFGLALLVGAIMLDLRSQRRQAFWFHLLGLGSAASGLTYHAVTHSSWGWVLILVAGILVLTLAAPLRRATWALFGIAGVYAPLAHFAAQWFGNLGTTAALALVGCGFLAFGIQVRAVEGGRVGLQFGKVPPTPPPAA